MTRQTLQANKGGLAREALLTLLATSYGLCIIVLADHAMRA